MLIVGTVPEWSFLEGVTVKVAVAHTLGNAQKVIDAIKSGENQYHFIEVMTCPGGCIGGGGQPRLTTNAVREARIAAIYQKTRAASCARATRTRPSSSSTPSSSATPAARRPTTCCTPTTQRRSASARDAAW